MTENINLHNRSTDIFHVCTNGLSKYLWFYDDEDYRTGMNHIPACALSADISILCFCLMSNHVHFIVKGLESKCVKFIREYKRFVSRQLSQRYGKKNLLVSADICIKRIDTSDYLKTALAYVMRNPTAAGMSILPTAYRWSSSSLYFAANSFLSAGKELGKYSEALKNRIIKTRVHLPDNYILTDDNMIHPVSYVDYRAVEKLYQSPKQLLYYLSSSKDMEVELESGILTKARYTDSELRASMDAVCMEKCAGRSFASLKIEDRYKIAKEMKRRYGVGAKQLARVMSLEYELLKNML